MYVREAQGRIRVLIVDPHKMVRQALRRLLESQNTLEIVGEAGDSAQALALVGELRPDVVLLDLRLGSENGLELLPDLLARAPSARVLVLTGEPDPRLHREAVKAGAMGVVLKAKAAEVVIKAIERVHAGEAWLDRAMIGSLLSQRQRTDSEGTKIARLTAREQEVIRLVAQGSKNRDIARQLFISEATVRHHLTSIFSKLEVEDRFELLIYAIRHRIVEVSSSGKIG